MKRDIYEFGNGCDVAVNLDKIVAVDIKETDGKWALRMFITDLNNIYNMHCDSKEIAEGLYNDIVSRMKEVKGE